MFILLVFDITVKVLSLFDGFILQLLEMLMNNIGDHVHRQVIDTGLLPILVKIVKKKVYDSFPRVVCTCWLPSLCELIFTDLPFTVRLACKRENISSS